MNVWVGLYRSLSTEELMLLNCGVGENSWESFGQHRDQISQPKGNQPWIFIGRTDAEAETPILGSPDVKSQLIGEKHDAEKDWRQEKWVAEDEMVGWYHQLNGHGFEQTLGDSEGQGSLVCCSSWGHKESDTLSDWTTALLICLKSSSRYSLLCTIKVQWTVCAWQTN